MSKKSMVVVVRLRDARQRTIPHTLAAMTLGTVLYALAPGAIEAQTALCGASVTFTAAGNIAGSVGSHDCSAGTTIKYYCRVPKLEGVTAQLVDPQCDPRNSACDLLADAFVTYPENDRNYPFPQNDPPPVIVADVGSPNVQCGQSSAIVAQYPAYYQERGRIDIR